MAVFGKQNSSEMLDKSNNSTARSMPISGNDKKNDDTSSNHDISFSNISKLYPIQPDNIPANLITRYESSVLSQLTTLNRIQTVVRFDYSKINLYVLFS
jgi:hypothetical protein